MIIAPHGNRGCNVILYLTSGGGSGLQHRYCADAILAKLLLYQY